MLNQQDIKKRKILVTSALPYANGDIHLGHIVEHIQTDIWVRFQKIRNNLCYYICADDAHGTPIMLAAEKKNITPEELIKKSYEDHLSDLQGFLISYDNYYSTHSNENKLFVNEIYSRLKANKKVYTKIIKQLYDSKKQMFLPDRFVKGQCPVCKAQDQYGDGCEVCGSTYVPIELINPYSTISGSTPVLKDSEHFFFKLSDCEDFLKNWIYGKTKLLDNREQNHLQKQSLNKIKEWLDIGLKDWDISRDSPYFGFKIPGEYEKYFYVWLDAPIGYLSSFKNLCNKEGIDYNEFLSKDSTTEMYHFIGKDILYFHLLFWPAILYYSNLRQPTAVFAHGFLTVNGYKMSKSRGTFIKARSYLDAGLNPEWMRYYLATKLTSNIEDFDLNFTDFMNKVNSDLIGKYINIASRSANFLQKRFNGIVKQISHSDLIIKLQSKEQDIAFLYETREYLKALKIIMSLADDVNLYVEHTKPWQLAKKSDKEELLHEVCSVLINAFKILTIFLAPILPTTFQNVKKFLNIKQLKWDDINNILINQKINPYDNLMNRVDKKMIENLMNLNKEN